MYYITPGTTDVTIYVRLRDSTTGLAKTGLAFNSAGASAYFTRPRAAAAAITLATLTVTGAHADGGFVEVDATNAKGLYRLDLPDAVCAVSPAMPYVVVSIEFDGTIEEAIAIHLGAQVDATMISSDATAANNLELDYDGTGLTRANSTIGTVTTIGATGLAAINAEVVDTLTTDTYAEAGSVPAATSSLKDKLNWLFALARNKATSTDTTITLRNDADDGSIATASQADDNTTYTRNKWT